MRLLGKSSRKPIEPEFIWPGKEPDVEDWDDDFANRLGLTLRRAWHSIYLYVLLPLAAVISVPVIVSFLAAMILQSLGYEPGSTTMIVSITIVAIFSATGFLTLIVREWRRRGFLRDRWPLHDRSKK